MITKNRVISVWMMVSFLVAAIAGGRTTNVKAVVSVNTPPVANAQTVSVKAGETIEIVFEGSDADGDPLTLYYIDNTTKGTLWDTDTPNATMYSAWANSTGTDSFHIVASDGQSISEPALVTINIDSVPVNHAPKTYNNYASTMEDTPVAVVLFASDPDGDPLTYNLVTNPEHGNLSGTGPNMQYTPAPDYNGSDSFQYSVSDGQLESNVSTMYISILPVNDTPVANAQTVSVKAGETIEIVFEGSDADGDPLTLYYIDNTTKGTLWDTDTPNATMYSAWANSTGTDSFHIVASDGQSISEPALVTINIDSVPVNHAPKTYNNYASTMEDTPVAVVLFASDPDGDPLTYNLVTNPEHGNLSGTGPNMQYTPASDYNGSDSFQYSVSDGQLESNVSTMYISILPVNDTPVANAQTVTIPAGGSKAITLTGSDADEDPLSYSVVTVPAHGSLSGSAPDLVYTFNAGYSGSDSFTFIVNDETVDSMPATVSINSTPPPPTTVFFDNFESSKGWTRNPKGTDTATKGVWERANPQSVYYGGYTQLGNTVSGQYDLVTGAMAGRESGSFDVDGGVTTIRSPKITLPTGRNLTLSFSYYFAHLSNSSSADYLKVKIIGATTDTVLQEFGTNKNDYASWASFSGSLNSYAGQAIYIQIECADLAGSSLVEAAVDDVKVIAQ